MNMPRLVLAVAATAVLAGCASAPMSSRSTAMATQFDSVRVTEHRGSDDLLTAGLGLAGLQAMVPPGFADAAQPTPGAQLWSANAPPAVPVWPLELEHPGEYRWVYPLQAASTAPQ